MDDVHSFGPMDRTPEREAALAVARAAAQPTWKAARGVLHLTDPAEVVIRRLRDGDPHLDCAIAVGNLRQALWDVYRDLGFDTDGDEGPIGITNENLCALVTSSAREFRSDYDALIEATHGRR